ncbi:MAG TPA: hypothetical protein DD713_01015 [Nitrospiraceae bacterium]|nr:hypothetical protein [Nitrospiraceae bacterium]
MKCNDSRKINYLSEYPQIVTGDLLEAKRHVNECRECKEFLEQEKAFASLLRQTGIKDKAPAELRQRILMATPARNTRSKLMYKLLSIAAILILFSGGYILKMHSDTKSLIGKIVEDHISFLSYSGIQVRSSNPDDVKRWFDGRVDFGVNIPELAARLKGGRLCLLDKKRLALVFYEHRGSQISLFMTGELNPERLLSGKEVEVKGRKVRIVEQKGYNLLLWQDRGLTYALVSDLSLDELKKII